MEWKRVWAGLMLLPLLGARCFDNGELVVGRNTPNPILLLHGLGGSASSWEKSGMTAYLEQKGLRYGGALRLGKGDRVERLGGSGRIEEGDVFALEISDPLQGLDVWTRELKALIAAVREGQDDVRVVLVGFSAGGVAARKYVVEHPTDHGVAKLVTISAPHQGSELAVVAQEARNLAGDGATASLLGSFLIEAIERPLGFSLKAPLLDDLMPERQNPKLAALNRARHPLDLEYACVVAVGAPPFADSAALQTDLAHLLAGKAQDSGLGMAFSNWLQGTMTAGEGSSYQGDGAVLMESQDLSRVTFFQSHRGAVRPCSKVEAVHERAKERYQAVVSAVSSPRRFLSARRVQGSSTSLTSLEVDFHHFFAGVASVKARSSISENAVAVSRPTLFQRGSESFGRVVVGPFDAAKAPAVDILVQGPEGGVYYGKRVQVGGEGERLTLEQPVRQPITLSLRTVGDLPERDASGFAWDLDGSPPDLRVVLYMDQVEAFRSRVISNVVGEANLDQMATLKGDPWGSHAALLILDDDGLKPPDLVGSIDWNPGELPRGPATVRTERGVKVQLEIVDPNPERIEWDPEAFLLPPA